VRRGVAGATDTLPDEQTFGRTVSDLVYGADIMGWRLGAGAGELLLLHGTVIAGAAARTCRGPGDGQTSGSGLGRNHQRKAWADRKFGKGLRQYVSGKTSLQGRRQAAARW
jgi:hypothetical protein